MLFDCGFVAEHGTDLPSVVGHKNGYFEKACVLFSIASMYSELGCSESKDSAEGARQSCIYFQVSNTRYSFN